MRLIFFFTLLCLQVQGQSSLFIELPHPAIAVGWNDRLLDSNIQYMVIKALPKATGHLNIAIEHQQDTLHLRREITADGSSDYRYVLTPVNSKLRFRYRGDAPATHHPYVELQISADSTVIPFFPLAAKPLAPLAESGISADTESRTTPADSTAAETAASTITEPPNPLPESTRSTPTDSTLQLICAMEMEFERLRASRRLAREVSLNKVSMGFLLRCLHYDNSRLLFLHDVRDKYANEAWFASLESYFDFQMSAEQFRKMHQKLDEP